MNCTSGIEFSRLFSTANASFDIKWVQIISFSFCLKSCVAFLADVRKSALPVSVMLILGSEISLHFFFWITFFYSLSLELKGKKYMFCEMSSGKREARHSIGEKNPLKFNLLSNRICIFVIFPTFSAMNVIFENFLKNDYCRFSNVDLRKLSSS